MNYILYMIDYFFKFNIILFFLGYNIIKFCFPQTIKNNQNVFAKLGLIYSVGFFCFLPLGFLITTVLRFNLFSGNLIYIMISLGNLLYQLKKAIQPINRQNRFHFYTYIIGWGTLGWYTLWTIAIYSHFMTSFFDYGIPLMIFIIYSICAIIIIEKYDNQEFAKNLLVLLKKYRYTIFWYVILISTLILLNFFYFYRWIWLFDAHMGSDPFVWESQLIQLYLEKYNNYSLFIYSYGFMLYCNGMISPLTGFEYDFIHYYCKVFPNIILIFDIILMIILLSMLFPKRKMIVWSTLIIFAQYYFIYRNFMFLPTLLITTAIILIIFLQQFDLPDIFTTFAASTTILIHPMSGLFVLVIELCYIAFKILFSDRKIEFKTKIRRLAIHIIPICAIFLIYALNVYTQSYMNLFSYYSKAFTANIFDVLHQMQEYVDLHPLYVPILEPFYANDLGINQFAYPFHYSLIIYSNNRALNIYFLIFVLIMLFVPSRFIDRKSGALITLSKLFVIASFIFFFSEPIYRAYLGPNEILEYIFTRWAYIIFQYRTLEIVAFPMIIIFAYGLYAIGAIIDRVIHEILIPKIIKLIKSFPAKTEKEPSKKINLPRISFLLYLSCTVILIDEAVIGNGDTTESMVINETLFDEEIVTIVRFLFSYQQANGFVREVYYDKQNYFMDFLANFYLNYDNSTRIAFYEKDFQNFTAFEQYIRTNAHVGAYLLIASSNKYFLETYYNATLGPMIYSSSRYIVIAIK